MTSYPASVNAGEGVTYTINLINDEADGSAVTLTDTLPAGTSYQSDNPPSGWTCNHLSGTVTCSGTIAGGSVATPGTASIGITVDVDPSQTAGLSNTVSISGSPDSDTGNNSGSVGTTISTSADLRVNAKTDTPDPVTAGNDLTYTIEVFNDGPSDAAAVSMEDPLPAGTTFVSLTPPAGWSCSNPGVGVNGTVSCTIDPLAAGTTDTFTLVVNVDSSVSGGSVLSNTATISSTTTADPLTGNESQSTTTEVVTDADLVVTKTGSPSSAVPGETRLHYDLTVTNNGPSDAVGVTVDDPLPEGLVGVVWRCSIAGAGACGHDGGTGSGDLDQEVDLPPGASLQITATGILHEAATGILDNQATVSLPAGIADPNLSNNTGVDDDTVLVPTADLAISKVHAPVTDTSVTYTIVVSNAGPSTTIGAQVQDSFPSGIFFDTGDGWSCSTDGGGTCTTSGSGDISDTVDLPPGATLTYTVDATLEDPAPDPVLVNTATVSGGNAVDPATANNSSSDSLTLAATCDLGITKTNGQTTAVAGTEVTYVLAVTNAGPDNVVGATVSDTFSTELNDVSWTCDATPPVPGVLSPVELHTVSAAGAVALSPDNEHLYAVGSSGAGDGRLVSFQRDTDETSYLFGRLGFLASHTTGDAPLGGAAGVVVSPDGRHVYVAATAESAVLIFERDWNTASSGFGTLSYLAAVVDDTGGVDGIGGIAGLALSPDGEYLYAAGGTDNAVAVFERDDLTGSLTWVERHDSGTVIGLNGAGDLALDPDGDQLYVTGAADSALVVLDRDPETGMLTHLETHTDDTAGVDGLGGAAGVVVSPDGGQVYVAGPGDGALAAFQRQADGTLVFDKRYDGLTAAQLAGVQAVAVSDDGQHLLAGGDAGMLVVFRRNTATGLLTYQEVLQDNVAPVDGLAGLSGIILSAGGEQVYTAASGDSAVGVLERSQPAAAFAFIEAEVDGEDDPNDLGGEVDGLFGARAVSVTPDGKHLYAAGFGEDAIAVFARDLSAGSTDDTTGLHLSFVEVVKDGDNHGGTTVTGLAGPTAVVTTNQQVYVASENASSVVVLSRDEITGELSFLESHEDGENGVDGISGALGLALDAAGAYLYVAGQYDAAIAVLARNAVTGGLSFVERVHNGEDGVEGLAGAAAVALSADGEHLYAVSRIDDALTVFERAADGTPELPASGL